MVRPTTAAVIILLLASCAGAAPERDDRVPRQRSVDGYVAMLENDERASWQRPAEVVAALSLPAGAVVADVGAGSGYFLRHLSRAVGPTGRVVAEDINPELVDVLRERIRADRLANATARLGTATDAGLEPETYDLVLLVNVYHHVAHPEALLQSLRAALRPGGRIAIVDYPPGDRVPATVSGPRHRVARERVLREAATAGLALAEEHDFLDYRIFLVLRPE